MPNPSFSFNIEALQLQLKRDVRRFFWILLVFSIVLIYPANLAGEYLSKFVRKADLTFDNIVIPKNVEQKEYVVSQTQFSEVFGDKKLLYVTVNNKQNTEIGFWPWVYKLKVLDANNQLVDQQNISSYLLPGEVKFITITTQKEGQALQIEEVLEQTQPLIYNPLASDIFKEPKITILKNEVSEMKNSSNLVIEAQLRNDDSVFIEKLEILCLIRDSRGAVVGASSTALNGFAPGTIRDFSIQYPKPVDKLARSVEIRFSVNYLDRSTLRLQ